MRAMLNRTFRVALLETEGGQADWVLRFPDHEVVGWSAITAWLTERGHRVVSVVPENQSIDYSTVHPMPGVAAEGTPQYLRVVAYRLFTVKD